MRASTAYFVGAGSIVAAIAIGLGGGIVAGNIMHPVAPKQGPPQRAESAAAPPTTMIAPSERVQYLTGSQIFGGVIATPAQADQAKPDVQTTQANAEPPAPPAPTSPPQMPKPAEQQASTEPPSIPDNAYAKARDSDVKRAASERRRTERRERWTERRHYYDARDARGVRDQTNWDTNWDDVARNVREDSYARNATRRPRGGIMLFGPDDD